MWEYEISTATLVHAATLVYVLGFLFRDQFVLRGLILLGSVLYILYYYFHLGLPQWDAIIGSALIAAATLTGLIVLMYERVPIGIGRRRRAAFDALGSLNPGQFRQLMKIGTLHQTDHNTILTLQGERPDNLYFVVEGTPLVSKDNRHFTVPSHCFVGEVSFMLSGPASASVVLPEGGTWIAWQRSELERMLERSPKLKQALNGRIAQDMALKVSRSTQMGVHAQPPAEQGSLFAPQDTGTGPAPALSFGNVTSHAHDRDRGLADLEGAGRPGHAHSV